jgi:Tfp pilus assembly protein PilF
MGVTFEGEPLEGGPRVAIKQLLLSRMDDWKVVDLFEREARVLSSVTHPAVPSYIEFLSTGAGDQTALYLVQQLAPGRSLADMVASGWRADEVEARRIAEALLDVLDYLHARVPPVYHRDVKPQNVIRDDFGKIWLVDFGSVRDVYRSTTVGGSSVVGTYGYMAPEQLRGVARPESDLYGLGATLIFLMTGESPANLPQRKLKFDFRSRVRVSPAFAAWLEKVLEPAPEDRFSSARQALIALRNPAALAGGAPRRRARMAILAGVLAIVASAGAFALVSERHDQRVARTIAAAHLSPLPERPFHYGFPAALNLQSIPAHLGAMSGAFTPDGKLLVTSGYDGTVRVWDAKTYQAVRALPGHSGKVGAVRITPDGHHAITAGDTTLRIWSLPDGKPEKTIDVSPTRVFTVAIAPAGDRLVGGLSGGTAGLWTLEGEQLATLAQGTGAVLTAAFSPDGTQIVTAGEDKTIRVWGADGTPRRMLEGHAATVDQVAVAPDGQTLASASDDHTVKIWMLNSGRLVSTLQLHTDEVWTVAFSPDGGTLLSGGKDGIIGIWSIPSDELRGTLNARQSIPSIFFASDGRTFASASANGVVLLSRLATAGPPVALPEPIVKTPKELAGPAPAQQLYGEATDFMDGWHLEDAETTIASLEKFAPQSAMAVTARGRLTFKQAQNRDNADGFARARSLGEQAIAIDSSFADAHILRGSAFSRAGDQSAARAEAELARKAAPLSARVLTFYASVLIEDGDIDGAQAALLGALSRPITRRQAAGVFDELGDVFWARADVSSDEVVHQRAIEMAPDEPLHEVAYAKFLMEKGDDDRAIAMAEHVLQRGRFGELTNTLNRAYCRKGERLLWDSRDPDGAARYFKDAEALGDRVGCAAYGSGAVHQYLGVTRHDEKEIAQAKEAFARGVQRNDKNLLAKQALAKLEP